MLVEYLSVVRPLDVVFSEKFSCKGDVHLNEFLWADYRKGVWDCDFLSDRWRVNTSEHGMQKHLKYRVDESEGNLNLLDVQAGHSSRTAGIEYAKRSTEDHRQISTESMHKFHLVSKEWQRLLLQQTSKATIEMRSVSLYGDS
jgi:hypothetical protein